LKGINSAVLNPWSANHLSSAAMCLVVRKQDLIKNMQKEKCLKLFHLSH